MVLEGSGFDIVKEFLVQKFKDGFKWVAFPYFLERLSVSNLHCFKEFHSAASYCEENQHYFKPISNVLKAIQPEVYSLGKPVEIDKLKNEIVRNSIEPYRKSEDLLTGLKAGELYPVLLNRKIDTDKELLSYKVYEHAHPGHQVYEVGHELGLLADFRNCKEALNFFDQHISNCDQLPEREKPDLLLIAELRHQKPQLDIEGIPLYNSALLLKTANPNYDTDIGKRVYDLKEWLDINSLVVKQPCLAKFNTQTSTLDFFNGGLNKIRPQDRIEFMPLVYYSTKEVTIAGSMKEKIGQDQLSENLNEAAKNIQKMKGL